MTYPTAAIGDALLDLHHVDTSADADYDGNDRTLRSVTERLGNLEAFSGTFDDENDRLTLEVTPLLVAVASVQAFLISQLADERGVSKEAVRFEVRQYLSTIPTID